MRHRHDSKSGARSICGPDGLINQQKNGQNGTHPKKRSNPNKKNSNMDEKTAIWWKMQRKIILSTKTDELYKKKKPKQVMESRNEKMAGKTEFQQKKSQWKEQKQTGHEWNNQWNGFNCNKSIETRQNFHHWSDKHVLKAVCWFEMLQRSENRPGLRRRIQKTAENTSSLATDFALRPKSFYRFMSSFLVMD
jgi:hypothetical protein